MRISLRDKNTSLKDFKKMFKSYYADMHESVREKAIIRDYENATGKKYVTEGSSKKNKRIAKGNAKADSESIGEHKVASS